MQSKTKTLLKHSNYLLQISITERMVTNSNFLRKQGLCSHTVQYLPPPPDLLSLFDSAESDKVSRVLMLLETSFQRSNNHREKAQSIPSVREAHISKITKSEKHTD